MFFNSFFRTLVGQQVTVELKNDLAVRGTLLSVDQYLNVRLAKEVRVVDGGEDAFPFLLSLRDTCYIRGSCVRYIHLPPDQVDAELLQDAARRAALEQKRAATEAVGESGGVA